MKHSVEKCDKKRKREVLAEIEKMEKAMKARHDQVALAQSPVLHPHLLAVWYNFASSAIP